jgi:hypothetical protein
MSPSTPKAPFIPEDLGSHPIPYFSIHAEELYQNPSFRLETESTQVTSYQLQIYDHPTWKKNEKDKIRSSQPRAQAPFIPENLNASEALKALNFQTGCTRKILQVLGDDAPVLGSHPIPSYFSFHVEELYRNQSFRLETETTTSSLFQVYNHPTWKTDEWDAIWSAQSLEVDPNQISTLVPELNFPDILFQIEISEEHLRDGNGPRYIYQGTTLKFRGYDASRFRHVAEWCHQTRDRKAYIKMAGASKNGALCPYNHPRFPSFILIVPTHLARVPVLPHAAKLGKDVQPAVLPLQENGSVLCSFSDHGTSASTSMPAHGVKKWTCWGNGRR